MKHLMLALGTIGSFALGVVNESHAQTDYPSRPVKIVVPYAAGGSTDILTRIMAAKLTGRLGQTFVVENRPGANGIIGTEAVARSPADGYTILMATNGQTINVGLHQNLPVDLEKDFAPIINIAAMPNLIVVHPSVPAKTIVELIALAKSKPGTLSYSHAGIGSPQHLAGEMFKLVAKVNIVGIPYKGGGPAVADAVAGVVPMVVVGIPAATQHINSGRLRGLAATSLKRSPLLPELPTVAESGYPGFDAIFWIAIIGPRGMPAAAVQKLNNEMNGVLRDPDIEKQFALQGATPAGGSPADLGAYIKKDIQMWSGVIKEANIKPER
jgi:tripartite-type tricarboxylate transporter receptor subunit TctC